MIPDSEEVHEIALAMSNAALHMRDPDVVQFYSLHGIDGLWHLAIDIVEQGPQNDMERRIIAEAMVRRLERK
jgi:hypothetical protein